jgi:hypothetical protein
MTVPLVKTAYPYPPHRYAPDRPPWRRWLDQTPAPAGLLERGAGPTARPDRSRLLTDKTFVAYMRGGHPVVVSAVLRPDGAHVVRRSRSTSEGIRP